MPDLDDEIEARINAAIAPLIAENKEVTSKLAALEKIAIEHREEIALLQSAVGEGVSIDAVLAEFIKRVSLSS